MIIKIVIKCDFNDSFGEAMIYNCSYSAARTTYLWHLLFGRIIAVVIHKAYLKSCFYFCYSVGLTCVQNSGIISGIIMKMKLNKFDNCIYPLVFFTFKRQREVKSCKMHIFVNCAHGIILNTVTSKYDI